ncbi:hypothetical protein SCHPADRAFT_116011 [Schizopora paradoxa]|uniref:Uncharacterized protein n=1 Tax=Schizopora paradoxa TaxID=27342 RepID=A0A0H2S3L0_9AGAM|nr:hypothetical protein SCHPADRAFT_116011 [Schizopora paradoxa]
MRPSVSNELKFTAQSRGWTRELQKLMTACMDADPRRRPSIDKAKDVLIAEMISRTTITDPRTPGSPESAYSRRSGSSSSSSGGSHNTGPSVHSPSFRSRSSWRASSTLESFPPTPRTHPERLSLPLTPVIASGSGSRRNSDEPLYSSDRVVYEEPFGDDAAQPPGECTDDLIISMQRGASTFRADSQNNISEHTIRPLPHSSFSDDDSDSDEGHLGQRHRDSTAYARMPKLQAPSISSSKRRVGNDRFRILVDRMTEAGRLSQNWVGVAPMEELRALTPKQTRQIRVVEELVKRESAFLAGNAVADHFARLLRADPGVLGLDRLEGFLTTVTEDSRMLRQFNQQFRDALQARPTVTVDGFQQVALLCKEAGTQFATVYPMYVRDLPEVQSILLKEMERNERFATLMKENTFGGQTIEVAMQKFLSAPITHLDNHPKYLLFIINEMPNNDRDTPLLREALGEMNTAVYMTKLSAWQQYGSQKPVSWSEFVSPSYPKVLVDGEAPRQSEIFRLISDERAYVVALKKMETKLLHRARLELYNPRNSEDGPLHDIIKAFVEIIADISRFHCQLLDNFYTIQRTQYPFIMSFVSACGVDQVPWHSLYEVRYGTLYKQLSALMQENRVRPDMLETLNRMTVEETGDLTMDFMTYLRTPCMYLRDFASRIRAISDATSEGNEDKQVLSEIWPRLWDVSHETEVMTSASREKARLSRLASALNISKYPGLENDIEIRSNGRSLFVSGQLMVTIKQGRDETSGDYYGVLLDNYLLLANSVSEQGIVRLDILEKPMPLDLISYGVDDSLNTDQKVSCGLLDYSGSPRRTLHLFASDLAGANMWSGKLKTAIRKRIQEAEAHTIMELSLIRRCKSAPTCSAEFYLDNPVTVIACDSPEPGLYIQKGSYEPHRVLSLSNIARMSAIAELKMLVVLADKTLYYFRFEELVNFNKPPPLHVLDENTNVSFYRVGYLPERTFLVVLARKKDKNIIRFYEGSEKTKSPSMIKYRSKRSPFRLLVDVEQPMPIRDICFLRSRLVLVAESFLVVDISSEAAIKGSFGQKRQILPLENDSMTAVVERCRKSNPISIQRLESNDFILCYADFAAYLNEHGQLSSRIVEWVSNDARGIAFRHPHMLVIGSAAVEIREMASGKLLQLLPAPRHLHLSWVGRYSEHTPSDVGVHLVMGNSAAADSAQGDPWYPNAQNTQYSLFKLRRR